MAPTEGRASSSLHPDELTRVELRAAVCEHGLSVGQLAAATTVDALTEQVAEGFPDEGDQMTARAILENVADLSPSEADSQVCEQLSLAYELAGVPATRTP